MTTPELRAALIAAFPPVLITRETIHSADADWVRYREREDLGLLEGKTWSELSEEILERHADLLVHAGGALFRTILPAYLLVLAEHETYSLLPFTLASQLSRKDNDDDRAVFDERVRPMTSEQRAAVRSAIVTFGRRPLLRDSMATALRSW